MLKALMHTCLLLSLSLALVGSHSLTRTHSLSHSFTHSHLAHTHQDTYTRGPVDHRSFAASLVMPKRAWIAHQLP